MVAVAAWLSALLTTVPVFVVLAWQWRRQTTAGVLALVAPFALALDLLVVLSLCRFVRLEVAVLVTRGLWIGGAAVLVARRPRGSWGRPDVLTLRNGGAVVAAFGLGALLSVYISRPYAIFDRGWHIPLVTSLRAQKIPFANVFDPAMVLHYHYSGDVYAAVAQTLSGGIITSSLALSIVHDLVFAETAASLVLLLIHLGVARVAAVVASFGVLACGPVTVLLEGTNRPWSGYSILSLFQVSYRPHSVLAGLLFVGVFGALLVRIHGPHAKVPPVETVPALVASIGLLGVTDEASTALLGLMIGGAWLLEPDVLHPRREVGGAILAGLLVLLVVSQLAFAGSLAPGGQHHTTAFVRPRSPGFYNPVLGLDTPGGRWTLFADFLPVLVIWVAGVSLALSTSSAKIRVTVVAFSVLAAASLLLVTGIDVDGAPLESHRFATAVLFAAPLLGTVWASAAHAQNAVPKTLVYLAMGLAGASTLEWIVTVAPVMAKKPSAFHHPEDLHDVDCRLVGESFGDRAELTYLDPSIWYLYAGCRPIFAPAVSDGQNWALQTKGPLLGQPAFAEIERMTSDREIQAVCARGSDDAICRKAEGQGRCEPAGSRALRCKVPRD